MNIVITWMAGFSLLPLHLRLHWLLVSTKGNTGTTMYEAENQPSLAPNSVYLFDTWLAVSDFIADA